MSIGAWAEKHPWMTFFLASSAIGGVVAIVRVAGGQPATVFGNLGVEMGPTEDLPAGWNTYVDPYAANQTVPYQPEALVHPYVDPYAADQSVPYQGPKGPPAWALPVGLGLTALAAVAFVGQKPRRSRR